MDPSSFSHQFRGMGLEEQLSLLEHVPEGVPLPIVLSTIFDLPIPRQREIFEQVPIEVQQTWVSQLTNEQKQILLQRAAAACEPEGEEEEEEEVEAEAVVGPESISVQAEVVVTVMVNNEVNEHPTSPLHSPPASSHTALTPHHTPNPATPSSITNSLLTTAGDPNEDADRKRSVQTVRTIMRTFGAFALTIDLLPLASSIYDHILIWLHAVLACIAEQQRNTIKYLSALYPLSIGPFLRFRSMDNLRKAKNNNKASAAEKEQVVAEEVWVPELSISLGQKYRLHQQNKATAQMSYADYAIYSREREESFLRFEGKPRPKLFREFLVQLCPLADKALTNDIVQLVSYLAKDRVGLITEVWLASGQLSQEGVAKAIDIINRLFPLPPPPSSSFVTLSAATSSSSSSSTPSTPAKKRGLASSSETSNSSSAKRKAS